MRVYSLFVMGVLLATTASPASAGGKTSEAVPSQKDQAIKFLKAHVLGKTFKKSFEIPESSPKPDKGKIEITYSSKMVYSNLVESSTGFMFDVSSFNKLTSYDLTKDGKRILPGREESSFEVGRFAIDQRVSTGKLLGFSRTLTTTNRLARSTGIAMGLRMEVRKGILELTESSIFYDDMFFAEKGKVELGGLQVMTRFTVTDGKVQGETLLTTFDVDPQTLKRTPRSDPPTKEILTVEP